MPRMKTPYNTVLGILTHLLPAMHAQVREDGRDNIQEIPDHRFGRLCKEFVDRAGQVGEMYSILNGTPWDKEPPVDRRFARIFRSCCFRDSIRRSTISEPGFFVPDTPLRYRLFPYKKWSVLEQAAQIMPNANEYRTAANWELVCFAAAFKQYLPLFEGGQRIAVVSGTYELLFVADHGILLNKCESHWYISSDQFPVTRYRLGIHIGSA